MAQKLLPAKRTNRKGFTIIDAQKPLALDIGAEHASKAKCQDPSACVIAQALIDHFGPAVDGFQVGGSITKVVMGKRIIRYATPKALRDALIHFDKTGKWGLKPGKFKLRPMSKSYRRPARWNKKRNSGGKQSTFVGRKMPTRTALTVCQLTAA